jgi:hypothetical protein
MATLTRKERKLRSEIEEIARIARMDIWNIDNYDKNYRATLLEMMKHKIVRGEVILQYTFIDEYLTDMICNYYFHKPREKHYGAFWKTKRFRIFAHNIMDEMYLLKKLSVVEAIKDVPSEISKAIKRINDVRNDLAHSFFQKIANGVADQVAELMSG